MSKTVKNKNKTIIYQAKSGAIELRGDLEHETVWGTQVQIASAFEVDVRTVNEHIQNIFKTEELDERGTIRNFRIVRTEGDREVERDVKHYNLDIILSVGYRVNSKKATLFRKWATKTLRQHITKGYTINPSVVKKNYAEFQKAIDSIKHLLPAGAAIDSQSVLELISAFADTWLSLDAYDKDTLVTKGVTRRSAAITAEHLASALAEFKSSLIKRGEATELFGAERDRGAVSGIVGNVMQSFGGKPVYSTAEEKAAHLLYFMVKNHPFADGNKRSGAYSFVWFLKKAGALDLSRITPPALTAITLFVAESDPKNRERIIRLILQLLKK
ncbi:MAG: virulence RhuM family protein [Candidatus Niyogibacteria bacterium]|nr:virulence RhuM family protein [Candidatus Niyogibacteria bacterium]